VAPDKRLQQVRGELIRECTGMQAGEAKVTSGRCWRRRDTREGDGAAQCEE